MEVTCFDCKYYREIDGRHLCYGQKGAPEIDPKIGCDSWKRSAKTGLTCYNMTIEKEDVINIIERYFNTIIELSKTVNCNNCKGRESCLFKPEPGQLIRYNCPIPKLLNITRSIRDE